MTISHVGAATGTTTFTIPTPQVGDLIVVWAFRSATGGVTLPAGWTNIANGNGTSSSFRLAYKIATSTSTASGTWTSATATLCVVYRSSNYATGSSLYVGGSATTHLTTTTITYPAVTMTHTDSTSWVAGFAGISVTTDSLSTHAPSGMTFISGGDLSNTVEVCAYDTNGTVNSWSSTNVTVSNAGNSCSAALEIIENQPGTACSNFVQHWSYGVQLVNSDPNTCDHFTYNIDPTLAGNGLVLTVAYPSGATPAITDNKSNTWPTSGGAGTVTADAGAGNMALQAFVLASATTGTSQIIVDFGGSPQRPVKAWITQLYNITGTINGSVHAASVNSAGIVSPGSFTPTNNNANGGNLILAYMADASTSSTTNPALIVPESNYALNDADLSDTAASGTPAASQFFLQATSAATTPRFYLNAGGTETYNVLALALSVGTQGTPKPSGPGQSPWIDRVCFFGDASSVTSWLLQVPSTGNCGVLMSFLNGVGVSTSASATDSDGTSWTQVTNAVGAQTPYYNANQTPKFNRTLTVAVGASGQPLQAIYYDVSNCATSPVVATAAGTDDNTSGTNTTSANQPSITPTGPNQLTLNFYANQFGPTLGITTPSAAQIDTPWAYVAKFVGGISGTSLTVSSTTWGTIDHSNNTAISGSGVTLGTTITSGTGPYVITPSQTVGGGTTMLQYDYDSNGLNWGNAAGHYYNGSDLTTQNWTFTVANSASTAGQGVAIILAGVPGASLVAPPELGGPKFGQFGVPRGPFSLKLTPNSQAFAPTATNIALSAFAFTASYGRAGITGQISLIATSETQTKSLAQPTVKAALTAQAETQSKTLLGAPSLKSALSAAGGTMAKSLAGLSGKVGLAAQTAGQIKSSSTVTAKSAMSATAATQVKAISAPTGIVGLAARVATQVKALGGISTGALVALIARATTMAKSAFGAPNLKAALSATAATQAKATAASSGKIGLAARVATQVKAIGTLGTGNFIALIARASAMAKGAFGSPSLKAALSARAAAMGSATAPPAGTVGLSARTTTQARAAASGTFSAAFSALGNAATEARFGNPVLRAALSATAAAKTTARGLLGGIVIIKALSGNAATMVQARAQLMISYLPVPERTLSVISKNTISIAKRVRTLIAKW